MQLLTTIGVKTKIYECYGDSDHVYYTVAVYDQFDTELFDISTVSF